MSKRKHSRFAPFFKGFKRPAAVGALAVFALAGWIVFQGYTLPYDPQVAMRDMDRGGWGAEVFNAVHGEAILNGLIKPANACGLGASSCFKCHNGQRAPVPGADPAKDPWHVQHASVNNSCVGCHAGNPRLMKESMAHSGLLADPRATPDKSCAACHQGSDIASLLQAYQSIAD